MPSPKFIYNSPIDFFEIVKQKAANAPAVEAPGFFTPYTTPKQFTGALLAPALMPIMGALGAGVLALATVGCLFAAIGKLAKKENQEAKFSAQWSGVLALSTIATVVFAALLPIVLAIQFLTRLGATIFQAISKPANPNPEAPAAAAYA